MRQEVTAASEDPYKSFVARLQKTADPGTREYIVGFAAILDLYQSGESSDSIASIVSEYFDTEDWPEVKPSGTPEYWSVLSETQAEEYIVVNLRGGTEYGNTADAMPKSQAQEIWHEFISFFTKTKTIYSVALGSHKMMQQGGIIVIDNSIAGVLNIGNAL